jgi:DNA-binding GntR family transcriptional regulator
LPPGTKLREEALCRLYGVSRTKIRAALLILSKDKLIQIASEE